MMVGDDTDLDDEGRTPLMRAAARGDADGVLRLLAGKPAEALEQRDRCGMTAVQLAAHKGDVKTLRLLTDAMTGLPPGRRMEVLARPDRWNDTALTDAMRHESADCLSLLLDVVPDEIVHTPARLAHQACRDGRPRMLRAILEMFRRRDPAQRLELFCHSDRMYRTVLMVAAEEGREDCMSMLLEMVAEFDPHTRGEVLAMKSMTGDTASDWAAMYGHVGVLEMLEAHLDHPYCRRVKGRIPERVHLEEYLADQEPPEDAAQEASQVRVRTKADQLAALERAAVSPEGETDGREPMLSGVAARVLARLRSAPPGDRSPVLRRDTGDVPDRHAGRGR